MDTREDQLTRGSQGLPCYLVCLRDYSLVMLIASCLDFKRGTPETNLEFFAPMAGALAESTTALRLYVELCYVYIYVPGIF